MTMRAHIPSVLAFAVLTACTHGTQPSNFPPALGPEGASIALRVKGETRDRVGELLAADSTGVTMLETRVVLVAWASIHAIDVDKVGAPYDVLPGQTAHDHRQLALLARFPQGLRGSLLAAVLKAKSQDTLDVIR